MQSKKTTKRQKIGLSVIGLKPGTTTITVTTEDGGHTATATLEVEQKVFHPLVIEADAKYEAKDYTVPSYIQMVIAKEAARRDSTDANVAELQAKIEALQPYQAPYDVVVNINGDPKTQMAFAWFTNETMTEGQVQLVAKANATEADFAAATTVEAATETTKPLPYAVDDSGILWKAKMDKDQAHTYTSHKAIATGLTPNTTYTYRVGVPPSSQILFSDNFPAAFHAEDLVVACDVIIGTMKKQ